MITLYLRRISTVQSSTIFVAGVGSFDTPVPALLAVMLRLNLRLQHGMISYVGALNSQLHSSIQVEIDFTQSDCSHPRKLVRRPTNTYKGSIGLYFSLRNLGGIKHSHTVCSLARQKKRLITGESRKYTINTHQ